MPVIDKYGHISRAFISVKHIRTMAQDLKAISGSIPFNGLQNRLDAMRDAYVQGIQPMLDLGNASAVNSTVGTFFAGTLPANTYTTFQAVGTALTALYNAYDGIFATLVPIDFSPATGHSWEPIAVSQLSTLMDELDAVIGATTPLL